MALLAFTHCISVVDVVVVVVVVDGAVVASAFAVAADSLRGGARLAWVA